MGSNTYSVKFEVGIKPNITEKRQLSACTVNTRLHKIFNFKKSINYENKLNKKNHENHNLHVNNKMQLISYEVYVFFQSF